MDDNPIEQNVQRIAKLLKSATQFLGVPHRQIERSMGLSTGYLSRIFSGKVELRVQHVLGICAAIGLPPAAFFEAAFPARDFDPDTARLVAALQELMPDLEAPARPASRKTSRRLAEPDRIRESTLSRARLASRILDIVLAELDEQEARLDED